MAPAAGVQWYLCLHTRVDVTGGVSRVKRNTTADACRRAGEIERPLTIPRRQIGADQRGGILQFSSGAIRRQRQQRLNIDGLREIGEIENACQIAQGPGQRSGGIACGPDPIPGRRVFPPSWNR